MGEKDIEKIETSIAEILVDKESSNGTIYTAIVLPNSEWVFAWEGEWKDEIDRNREIYLEAEVEIFVVDKEDDSDDHFYNLEAIVPQDPELAEKLLEQKQEDIEKPSEEDIKEMRETVEEIYG